MGSVLAEKPVNGSSCVPLAGRCTPRIMTAAAAALLAEARDAINVVGQSSSMLTTVEVKFNAPLQRCGYIIICSLVILLITDYCCRGT